MSESVQDTGVRGDAAALPTSLGLFVVERRLPKIDDHQQTVLQKALTSAASRFGSADTSVLT